MVLPVTLPYTSLRKCKGGYPKCKGVVRRCKGVVRKCKGVVRKCKGGLQDPGTLVVPHSSVRENYSSFRFAVKKMIIDVMQLS